MNCYNAAAAIVGYQARWAKRIICINTKSTAYVDLSLTTGT